MNPALVILAAGLGRRFGGLKQLAAVGPHGSAIMDYTVYDALRAGFETIVFVVRPEMETEFDATLAKRFGRHAHVRCVVQRIEPLPDGRAGPAGRHKPWGTAQAVLTAAEQANGPFGVANADDFYGPEAFAALGMFLQQAGDPRVHGLVGYRLRDTLPESGAVARAICQCTPDGWLAAIREVLDIERCAGGGRYPGPDGRERRLDGDQRVSMNLWGFRPAILDPLRRAFASFIGAHGDSPDAELYLPAVVQNAIDAGEARVRVLPGGSTWCGITHPADQARVARRIEELIGRGTYPARLWT